MFLTVFDKQTGSWQHAELKATTTLQHRIEITCDGQLGEVAAALDHYFVSAEPSPSAECTLVLDNHLRIETVLDGWPVAFLPPDAAVYEGSMVHFADVHPETLWLYDTKTRQKKKLYPQPHDPFRQFATKLEKAIRPKLCMANNWACEPDHFSSEITIPLATNAETISFAVRVMFSPEGFVPAEEYGEEWRHYEFVYVYQLNPFRWREFRSADLKQQFGTESLKELLMPEMLEKVFSAAATN